MYANLLDISSLFLSQDLDHFLGGSFFVSPYFAIMKGHELS